MTTSKTMRAAFGLLIALASCTGAGAPPSPDERRPRAVPPAAPAAQGTAAAIAAAARPIAGTDSDYADIYQALARSSRILLGESTHGTHEYYRERARISERLIREHGIVAVAVEGDWTPTYQVNRYVRGLGSDRSAEEALGGYRRFPEWMWANTDFRDFVERLRAWNLTRPAAERVGVYGMDVYDLYEAADAVVAYLRGRDPRAAARARAHYRCFAPYRRSTHEYGEATLGGRVSCRTQAEAVDALVRRIPRPDDPAQAEDHFAALRASASVMQAEEYFRTAYGGTLAWNVRDRHMARNVEEIAAHLRALSGRPAKVVMWSHNTHSGDARATLAANRGELNLGQLMREAHGDDAFLIGLFSYRGTVYAAHDWDRPGRVFEMTPALPGSHSALFRETGLGAFSLLLRGNAAIRGLLAPVRLERAIGVVYRPETERQSHYFEAELPRQFDAVLFFERSSAVAPLQR